MLESLQDCMDLKFALNILQFVRTYRVETDRTISLKNLIELYKFFWYCGTSS